MRPRADWARGLTPTGPLQQERPGDTRFLLVHHTASANGYDPGDVPGLLRGFYRFHTGPDRKWPDVAYNFFVDRYGTVWEGRTGSLAGPVMADATGGSQGFAQLCCFIGNHQVEAPTPEARTSMTALLAALADTYAIETAPGATTTFVSRGSNRWPAGTTVTTTTIAGHRDMSLTTCPGDTAYELVSSYVSTRAWARSPGVASGSAVGAVDWPQRRAGQGLRACRAAGFGRRDASLCRCRTHRPAAAVAGARPAARSSCRVL